MEMAGAGGAHVHNQTTHKKLVVVIVKVKFMGISNKHLEKW